MFPTWSPPTGYTTGAPKLGIHTWTTAGRPSSQDTKGVAKRGQPTGVKKPGVPLRGYNTAG